jgi:hypothetical protein
MKIFLPASQDAGYGIALKKQFIPIKMNILTT